MSGREPSLPRTLLRPGSSACARARNLERCGASRVLLKTFLDVHSRQCSTPCGRLRSDRGRNDCSCSKLIRLGSPAGFSGSNAGGTETMASFNLVFSLASCISVAFSSSSYGFVPSVEEQERYYAEVMYASIMERKIADA